MVDPRQYPGSGPNISVGGPGGIQIHGGQVQMGGQPMPGGSAPLVPIGSNTHALEAVPRMAKRNPKVAAGALAFAGVTLAVASITGVFIVGLPLLALALPALFSTALLVSAGVLFSRSNKYLATGGLDVETERRLIDVAIRYRGRVTAMAAARELEMSIGEADAALTALTRAGHVAVDNDPKTGILVYSFPEIEAGLLVPGGPDAGPRRLT